MAVRGRDGSGPVSPRRAATLKSEAATGSGTMATSRSILSTAIGAERIGDGLKESSPFK
jgi:hypothetical protein